MGCLRMATFTVQEDPGDVASVSDIMRKVNELRKDRDHPCVYFRGHTKANWPLQPTIGRDQHYVGMSIKLRARRERALLSLFRRYAYHQVGRVISEWEGILLARHHGLPARLLDWSSSPLVALYFACADEGACIDDGAVWCCVAHDQEKEKDIIRALDDKHPPLQIQGIKIVFPFAVSPRIPAQSCIFTIQKPWRSLDSYAGTWFRREDLDVFRFIKWRIPKSSKPSIIADLERAGVNRRGLFPDLDGLAKWLWQLEVVREIH